MNLPPSPILPFRLHAAFVALPENIIQLLQGPHVDRSELFFLFYVTILCCFMKTQGAELPDMPEMDMSPDAFPSSSGDRGTGTWIISTGMTAGVVVVVVVVAVVLESVVSKGLLAYNPPPVPLAPPPPPDVLSSGPVPTAPAAAVAFFSRPDPSAGARLNVSSTLVLYPLHLSHLWYKKWYGASDLTSQSLQRTAEKMLAYSTGMVCSLSSESILA